MKKILLMSVLMCTAMGSAARAVDATAKEAPSKEEQDREERIRYNLRQGAFHLQNGVYDKTATNDESIDQRIDVNGSRARAKAAANAANANTTSATAGPLSATNRAGNSTAARTNRNFGPAQITPAPIAGLSALQLKDRLAEWGVSYLFMLDHTDLKKEEGAPFYSIEDFMGNAQAESRGGNKFQAQVCKNGARTGNRTTRAGDQANRTSAAPATLAARFDRLSPADQTGGYLLVKEADASTTNLSAYDGFSMGAWIKLDGSVTSGAFPILSKTALNQVNAQGKNEWEFRVTGNVVYLNVNRAGFTQNLSFNIPWWGDRFGQCYENGIYQECWHYVGLSFDPAINKISVLFLRKFANNIPQPAAENFLRHELSAQENSSPIETSRQTPLRIGASNTSSMNGILKGVFFARKALSAQELKAMATLTVPSKGGLLCNRP